MQEATDLLHQISSAKATELSARDALVSLLNEFGGYDEWARQVMLDMEAVKLGSMGRISLHKMFLTALLRFAEDSEDDDLDTEEQIEALVRSRIGELTSTGTDEAGS